jgi:hypothetical protein
MPCRVLQGTKLLHVAERYCMLYSVYCSLQSRSCKRVVGVATTV